jgi:hypothetical protein
MTIEEILALSDFAAIKKELTVKATPKVAIEDCLKQYDPLQHDVRDEAKRPKKMVQKATGQKDAQGNPIYADARKKLKG